MGNALNIAKRTETSAEKLAKLGELADAKYSERTLKNPPSLQALKLQDVLIKNAGGQICEDRWHELDLATFKRLEGIGHLDQEQVYRLFEELRGTTMRHENKIEGYMGIFGMIAAGRIDFEEVGRIRYQFDAEFRKVMEASNLYAVMDYRTSLALSSRYAHRLHEMIALRAGRQHTAERFSVGDLRARLGVQTGKLEEWSDFKKRALEAAIAEVNQSSRFAVSYRISKKERRKTVEVELTWTVKDDLKDAKQEQAAHSAARKGRRADATAKLAFPESGSVRYTDPWEKIARENCNWDNSKIADAFRSFCNQRNLKLDAKNIETVFADFCRKQTKI
ncbi:MAG: replication initiation protein [Paracoccaceae bacterium]|nr:replication initiation protein [Paracoccaceae bacterium]